MTATSSFSPAAYCEANEFLSPRELIKIGLDGSGRTPTTAEAALGLTAGEIARQALELGTKGYVEFTLTFTATTNDNVDLRLDTIGATFGTGFARKLEAEVIAADGDNVTMEKTVAIVEGNDTIGSAVVTYDAVGTLVTNGLTTAAVNPHKTSVSGLGLTGVGAQTLRFLIATGVVCRYVGQSSDATTGTMKVRVYPKTAQAVA